MPPVAAERLIQRVGQIFGGSLPAFLAAFTRENTLTREQADSLQALIDAARAQL